MPMTDKFKITKNYLNKTKNPQTSGIKLILHCTL